MNKLSRNCPIAMVVGAAGFIGSSLIDKLLSKQIQVIGIDDLSSGNLENLKEAYQSNLFYFLNSNFKNIENLQLPRLDYLFITINEDIQGDDFKRGLKNLCEILQKNLSKILLVSSNQSFQIPDQNKCVDLEKNLADFSSSQNLNARIVRLGPVYGPRMQFCSHDPLTKLLQEVLTTGNIAINSTYINYSSQGLYIEDAVNLLIKAMVHGSTANQVFEGIDPQPFSLNEVRQLMLDPYWHDRQKFTPTPLLKKNNLHLEKNEVNFLLRNEKILNWHCQTPLITALRETFQFFKDRPYLLLPLSERTANLNIKQDIINKPDNEAENRRSFAGGLFYQADQDTPVPVVRKLTKLVVAPQKQVQAKTVQETINPPGSAKKILEKEEFVKVKHSKIAKSAKAIQKHLKRGLTTTQHWTPIMVGLFIIILASVVPIVSLIYQSVTYPNHLLIRNQALISGNFDLAKKENDLSEQGILIVKKIIDSAVLLRQIKPVETVFASADQMIDNSQQMNQGVSHLVNSGQAVNQVLQVILAGADGDINSLWEIANTEIEAANLNFSQLSARLSDPDYISSQDINLLSKFNSLQKQVKDYQPVVSQANTAIKLLSKVTTREGAKKYLVLLEDESTLRPMGGQIKYYALLTYQNRQLGKITVGKVTDLDSKLPIKVEPPAEIKTDLLINNWYLRDANTNPDFPEFAKTAAWFYSQESKDAVDGVIYLDFKALADIIKSQDGVYLPTAKLQLTQNNVDQNLLGWGASDETVREAFQETLNKTFYMNKSNWMGLFRTMIDVSSTKHLFVYLSDPEAQAILRDTNYSGIFPRQEKELKGERTNFLSLSENNLLNNRANLNVKRDINLATSIAEDGQVKHQLKVIYQSQPLTPGAMSIKYRFRLKVYLSSASTLETVNWRGLDITKSVTAVADYGRAGYSMVLELEPGDKGELNLSYRDFLPVSWSNQVLNYSQQFVKQPSTNIDQLHYSLVVPGTWKIASSFGFTSQNLPLSVQSEFNQDQKFGVTFSQN